MLDKYTDCIRRSDTTRTSEVPFRQCQMNAAVSGKEFDGLSCRTPLLNPEVRVWLYFHRRVYQQYQKILFQELSPLNVEIHTLTEMTEINLMSTSRT